MQVSFQYPLFLLLGILLWVVYFVYKRNPESENRQDAFFYGAVIIFIVLGLSGLQVKRRIKDIAAVYLLDISHSIDRIQREHALSWIKRSLSGMTGTDRAGLVAFAKSTHPLILPAKHRKKKFKKRLSELSWSDLEELDPDPNFTDIAQALEEAYFLFPDHYQKRIVLISDGRKTAGKNAVLTAQSLGAAVDVYQLGTVRRQDGMVEEVAAPERVAVGERFYLKVSLNGNLSGPVRLSVLVDKFPIGEIDISLEGKKILYMPVVLKKSGRYIVSCQLISDEDGFPANNWGGVSVTVAGEPKILYITNQPNSLARILKSSRINTDIRTSLPDTLIKLTEYAAIVLDNIPAAYLSDEMQKMLKLYTREFGGGLLMVGGPDSFGAGGYQDTPLEDALPTLMEVEKKRRAKSLAVVLLMDKSKSMRGMAGDNTKMKIASAAAINSLKNLIGQDYLGVAVFDVKGSWIRELGKFINLPELASKINQIEPGGKTDISSGLRPAIEALAKNSAGLKHIILFTDGKSKEFDHRKLTDEMKKNSITLSSVGIGLDVDHALLKKLAEEGGGRTYFSRDYKDLENIFSKEIQIASRSLIIEDDFTPRVGDDHKVLFELKGKFPTLHGYVATTLKESASAVLVATADQPLLALWRYGLGKSVSFTTASGTWLGGWENEADFKRFWVQVLRWSMRESQYAKDFAPHLEYSGGKINLTIDTGYTDQGLQSLLQMKATVVEPDLDERVLKLQEVEPGLYKSELSAEETGVYYFRISDNQNRVAITSMVIPCLEEERNLRADPRLLSALSQVSGGKQLGAYDTPYAFRRSEEYYIYPLWKHCLLLALFSFVANLILQKINLIRKIRGKTTDIQQD